MAIEENLQICKVCPCQLEQKKSEMKIKNKTKPNQLTLKKPTENPINF